MNYIYFASWFASCPHADVKLRDLRLVSLMHRPRSNDEAVSNSFPLDSIPRPWGSAASLLSLGSHSRAPFHVSDEVHETVFVVLGECANGGH